MLLQKTLFHYFLMAKRFSIYLCMTPYLSIYLSMDRHSGCSYVLATVLYASMNIKAHASFEL